MSEIPSSFKNYESGQGVNITRKEEGQEWSFDNWGDCRFELEDSSPLEGNYYTDPRIINRLFTQPIVEQMSGVDRDTPATVVDFGGGSGIMLAQINSQLQEAGFTQINPILIDADEQKIEQAKIAHPEIQSEVGDAFHLQFADNSVDAGVSRNLIQYFPPPKEDSDQPNQFDVLKEMYRVMKPGSTLVLVWAGAYKYDTHEERVRAGLADMFWSQITWDRTADYKEGADDSEDPLIGRRSFEDSLADVEDSEGNKNSRIRALTPGQVMADFAQKAGFEIEQGEEIDWIEFRYTYDSIVNRFGEPQEDDNKRWLQGAFTHLLGAYRRYLKNVTNNEDDIIDWEGKPAIRVPVSRLILEKRGDEQS